MDFDPDDQEEILSFVESIHAKSDLQDLLDGPFARKPVLETARARQSRFSDGRLRIFYSSLELETAKAETFHWYAKAALASGSAARTVYYERFHCRFQGTAWDLRLQASEWSFLADPDESAYPHCQHVAAEAVAAELDGLLTPSARNTNGTNAPVFSRTALSEPQVLGYTAFSSDPDSGRIRAVDR